MRPNKFCYLYFIILFVYFTQAFIFKEDRNIGSVLIVAVFGINMWYMLMSLSLNRRKWIISAATVFLAINFIYFLWGEAAINNVPSKTAIQIFKTTLLSISCIFPVFYWARKGLNLDRLLLCFALGYLLVLIYNLLTRDVTEHYVDNLGYYYINIIPFVLLIRKRSYLKIGLCLLLTLFVIQSAKRGAILTVAVADVFFCFAILKNKEISKNFLGKSLLLVILIIAAIYAYKQFMFNEFAFSRFEQLEEGQTSGRGYIYSRLISHWLHDSSLVQMVFGSGYCAVPTITGGPFAHNDWLELLTDLGLVGIVVYFTFVYSMFSAARKQTHGIYKWIMFIVVAIWGVKTLFSMSYLDENNFMLTMLIGYMTGKERELYEKRTAEIR